jgi:hypothetical protein
MQDAIDGESEILAKPILEMSSDTFAGSTARTILIDVSSH